MGTTLVSKCLKVFRLSINRLTRECRSQSQHKNASSSRDEVKSYPTESWTWLYRWCVRLPTKLRCASMLKLSTNNDQKHLDPMEDTTDWRIQHIGDTTDWGYNRLRDITDWGRDKAMKIRAYTVCSWLRDATDWKIQEIVYDQRKKKF